MQKKLMLSESARIPLDWMLSTTVVYGARGSGKTVFSCVMAEEVHSCGQRFCAIDLKGDFYGLKSSADGKQKAIPAIVFGGDHADLPLEPEAGAFIADVVSSIDQSCILDLEHMQKTQQIAFLCAFFLRLYQVNRRPLLLLLDEAQRYAPQNATSTIAQQCLEAVIDLVKLGRKHGLGVVVTTQRGAGLNKEVSELCEMLVAFRTPGTLDQDRVSDWLKNQVSKTEREAVMARINGLPTGTAMIASSHPDLKLFGTFQIRMRSTFDSSSTPKIGQRKREPKMLATADLTAIKLKMTEAIERAKLDDPKALRAKVVELERELKKLRAQKPVEAEPITVEIPVINQKDLDRLMEMSKQLSQSADVLSKASSNVHKAVSTWTARASENKQRVVQPVTTVTRLPLSPKQLQNSAEDTKIGRVPPATHSTLGNDGLRRIMTALAVRPTGLTDGQIGARTGLSHKSGTFATYISKGKTNGWIVDGFKDSTKVRVLTKDGLLVLGPFEPLPTGKELLNYWIGKLGGGPSRMLKALSQEYPGSMDAMSLGQAAGLGHESGTFATYISTLKTLELITGGRGVPFRMSDELSAENT